MVYREFEENDHLDKVVGVQLPQYQIVDSRCDYVSSFSSETEYDVKLKIYFPEGISGSVWGEMYKSVSRKASNPLLEVDVINERGISADNADAIVYKSEDLNNVGCNVIFKHYCDTVYVTRYKW